MDKLKVKLESKIFIILHFFIHFNFIKPTLIRKVLEGKFSFYDTKWKSISPTGIDFVRKLVVENPTKRIGLSEVKNHNWFTT